MKKRRKYERAGKFFAVNIVAVDVDGKHIRFDNIRSNPKFADETGLDFSPKGIRIMCSRPLPVESKIQIKMLIPDRENLNLIRANGAIKWFKQVKGRHKKYFIIGVNFRKIAADDRQNLLRLWRKYK